MQHSTFDYTHFADACGLTDLIDVEGVLATVHPTLLPGETYLGRYIHPQSGTPAICRFYTRHAHLLADVARYRSSRHCYVGPALRRGQDGTARGVTRSLVLWGDIDGKLWNDCPDPKASALTAVEHFRPRPSLVVDSGGGPQVWWIVDEPADLTVPDVRRLFLIVNRALPQAICGPERRPDCVHDLGRVMRLPGTLNLKPEYGTPRPTRVVCLEPERRYSLVQLHEVLATRFPWALVSRDRVRTNAAAEEPQPFDGNIDSLRQRAERGRIRHRTLTLLDRTGACGYKSAFEADAAIAAGLIAAALAEGEALALIIASARGKDAARRKRALTRPHILESHGGQ